VAQRVGKGIALLFHDRDTSRPHFTPGEDPVPVLLEAAWAPGPVWTGGKSRPHRDLISDRPARSSVAIPTELPAPYIYIYIYIYILYVTSICLGRRTFESAVLFSSTVK